MIDDKVGVIFPGFAPRGKLFLTGGHTVHMLDGKFNLLEHLCNQFGIVELANFNGVFNLS